MKRRDYPDFPPIPQWGEADYSKQYVNDMKSMMGQLKEVLNSELLSEVRKLRPAGHTRGQTMDHSASVPIQIWATDDQYIIRAAYPGIATANDAKVQFLDEDKIKVRLKKTFLHPPSSHCELVSSDFSPARMEERTVNLPGPVKTKSMSKSCEHGIVSIYLTKAKKTTFDMPIDY